MNSGDLNFLLINTKLFISLGRKEQKVHPEDDDKFDARKEATIPDSSEVGGAAKVFIEPDAPETGSQGKSFRYNPGIFKTICIDKW